MKIKKKYVKEGRNNNEALNEHADQIAKVALQVRTYELQEVKDSCHFGNSTQKKIGKSKKPQMLNVHSYMHHDKVAIENK